MLRLMGASDYIQANTGGRLHPAHEPSISPLNRGFLYGDAVYEVWRSYHGHLFAWEEHWARLERSAQALHLPLPWSASALLEEVTRTAAAFRAATGSGAELYVRLQVFRGAGPIGLDTALASEPGFVLLVQPCPQTPETKCRTGLRLVVAQALRRNPVESLSPAWKTGNYLNNILGLREARARGGDDVVMLNLGGEITEAATSNLAFVDGNGAVITPPLDAGILPGITRALLLARVAPAAGITIREAVVRPEELSAWRECFLLSTTRDLTPVAAIDGWHFEVGPGTVTARLKAAFAAEVRAYVAAHPELRV